MEARGFTKFGIGRALIVRNGIWSMNNMSSPLYYHVTIRKRRR